MSWWLIVFWLTPGGDNVRSESPFETQAQCEQMAEKIHKMVTRDIKTICVPRAPYNSVTPRSSTQPPKN